MCNYYDYLISCCNSTNENMWAKPNLHPCRKTFSLALESDLDLDYADLVNSVQRHSKCNAAYCLKMDKDGNQKCRFNFPQDLYFETFVKYNEIVRKTGNEIRPELVWKRNDSRVNRHQQIQLQGWRANCDIQLIIDHHACIEYLAKYASKGEKMSSVARDAFVNVVSRLRDDSSPKSAIRKLMMKCVGERDMGIQEVMHQILSLNLYRSSFNVITVSLENSRKCTIKSDELTTDVSHLELYADRLCYSADLKNVNVIKGNNVKLRKEPVIVRTIPSYSSNPEGINYGKYCKFQLLKYKVWRSTPSHAWDNMENTDATFVSKWQEFLESETGKTVIPNW